MKKYTLQEIQELLDSANTMIVSGLNGMIKIDPDNDELYRAILRRKDTISDINAMFSDLIEEENEK